MTYVNSIIGWQFPEPTIKAYLESAEPKLLTMDFDFPCKNKCNLRCKYCFIERDERESEFKGQIQSEKLTFDELKNVFKEAAKLGCKSAKLVGDQEPLLENRLLEFLDFVSNKLKMWVVVFTNGSVLSNDKQCFNIHGLDSQAMIDKLKELRVSIMLKFHSFSNQIEDDLVQRPGYSKKRNYVLRRLMKAGFNEPPTFDTVREKFFFTGIHGDKKPDVWTRLGLESVITPQCLNDAEAIYKLKMQNRLYVDLDPPVPVGLTKTADTRRKYGLYIPKAKLLNLAVCVYKLNREYGVPFKGASPYFGGLPCSQLPYGIYVNSRGRIYPCCGCPDNESRGRSDYLGNIREPNAMGRAIKNNPYRIHYEKYGHAYNTPPFNFKNYEGYGIYHGCPYRDRASDILPNNWEMLVQNKLSSKKQILKVSNKS